MPDVRLKIEGVGTVRVDDSFKSLSPDEQNSFVQHIVEQHAKGINSSSAAEPTPQAPSATPKGGMLNAAEQSVSHGLFASLAGGAATLGETIDRARGVQPGSIVGGLRDFANTQRQDIAQNYQRPSDVDPSPIHALSSGNIPAALRSAGYGAAENLGTTGAALGTGALALASAPISLPAAGVAAGLGALEAADSVNEGRRAAGLQADQGLNGTDLANVGAQTVLNALPIGRVAGSLARGVGRGLVTNEIRAAMASRTPELASRIAGNAGAAGADLAGTFAKGAGDSLLNAGSEAEQGGNVGSAADVLRNAGDNGLNGLIQHAALATGAGAVQQGSARAVHGTDLIRLGSANRAGLDALQDAQKNGTPIQNTAPEAQMVSRLVDALPFTADRRAAEGPNASIRPIQETIGSNRSEVAQTLNNTADNLKATKAITKQDYDALKKAITQAHNQNATAALSPVGDEGATLQTHMDRVANMDIDPEIKQQFLHGLGVLDTTAANKVKKRANPVFAPLLKNMTNKAVYALPSILGVSAELHGGSALGGVGAGILGGLAADRATGLAGRMGTKLDNYYGFGMPDMLRNSGPLQRQAARMGIKPSVTGQSLNELENDTLNAAQNMQQQAGAPFHRSAPIQARQAPVQQPQSAPTQTVQAPAPTQAPTQAPQAPQAPQGPAQATMGSGVGIPFNLANINMQDAKRYNPGWMGAMSELEPNKTKLHNFLANLRDAGQLSPEEHQALATTDNIGDNLGHIQNLVSDLQEAGNWNEATKRASGSTRYDFLSAGGRRQQQTAQAARSGDPLLDAQGNPIISPNLYDQRRVDNDAARDRALSASNMEPALVDVIHRTHQARTLAEKNRIVQGYIDAIPARRRAKAYATLRPLLDFGK